MSNFTLVANKSEFTEDEVMKKCTVNDTPIILCFTDNEFFAVHAICTHEHAELIEGDLEGRTLTCPLHFTSYDIKNGKVISPPATKKLPTFDIKIDADGGIWVSNNSKR